MATTPGDLDLSIVIPSYNSAPWLDSTLDALETALAATDWRAEILVVDDGSTDDTGDVLLRRAASARGELRVVDQANQGVFLAVWNGLRVARSEWVLILNSRLLIHDDALAYLQRAGALSSARAWNGHVVTDPETPLVGRFWEVPTHVFWGDYLADPRPMDITPANFDRVPKGTGCFLVRRTVILDAYNACWPDKNARFASDDTKLLRHIAAGQPIRLDPGFSATYRPRTTLRKFLAHARGRGTMFVDSYAGTSGLRNVVLIGLVLAPPLVMAVAVAAIVGGRPRALAWLGALGGLAISAPAVVGALRRAPRRAIQSYFLYILPFGAVFWRGLLRGAVLHRRSFRRRHRTAHVASGGHDPVESATSP